MGVQDPKTGYSVGTMDLSNSATRTFWKGNPWHSLIWDGLGIIVSICFLGRLCGSWVDAILHSNTMSSPRSMCSVTGRRAGEYLVEARSSSDQDCTIWLAYLVLRPPGQRHTWACLLARRAGNIASGKVVLLST